MSNIEIGLSGLGVLLFLVVIRTPVAVALIVVGSVGIWLIRPTAVLTILANETFAVSSRYSLTILPLFILMGNLAGISGISRDLYDAGHAWFGRMRGGLASSTIAGCAGFSALSGSSLAATLTMGRVALPEMRRYNYDTSLATGCIAAGGTLGILIPPSAGFVIYAALTEESVARLFLAGIFPGLLLTSLFILTIWLVTTLKPQLAPVPESPASVANKFQALCRAAPTLSIALITLGGIYLGIFDAVEAASIGTFLVLIVAIKRRSLNKTVLREVMFALLKSTGSIFYIIVGAFVFKTFIALSGIPLVLSDWLQETDFSGIEIIVLSLAVFILLGTLFDGYTILILAIPLLQPVLENNGFDMVWYGVLAVILIEMSMISPPVGLAVFAVKSIAPDVPVTKIFLGILPFWAAMFVAVILIAVFPQMALFLPGTMFR